MVLQRSLTPYHYAPLEEANEDAPKHSQSATMKDTAHQNPNIPQPQSVDTAPEKGRQRKPVDKATEADGIMMIELSHSVFEEAARTVRVLSPSRHSIGDRDYGVIILVLPAEYCTMTTMLLNRKPIKGGGTEQGQNHAKEAGDAAELGLAFELESGGFGSDDCLFEL